MTMARNKFAFLAVGIVLAMAFTLSCSDGGSQDGENSSSSENNPSGNSCSSSLNSSSSLGALSSSSSGDGGSSSSAVQCLDADSGTFFTDDRDGKEYRYVTICSQIWMAENLNYNASSSKCYGNDPENCEKYGRLYDWSTALTVCPSGWHLPNNEEWSILILDYVGEDFAGTKLKATSGWDENGTDDYGFSALPGGFCDEGGFRYAYSNNTDYNIGFMWSADEYENGRDAYSLLFIDGYGIEMLDDNLKSRWLSVRCIKD